MATGFDFTLAGKQNPALVEAQATLEELAGVFFQNLGNSGGAIAEEKAEAEFAHLVAVQVRFQAQHRVEIMRTDLDQ